MSCRSLRLCPVKHIASAPAITEFLTGGSLHIIIRQALRSATTGLHSITLFSSPFLKRQRMCPYYFMLWARTVTGTQNDKFVACIT